MLILTDCYLKESAPTISLIPNRGRSYKHLIVLPSISIIWFIAFIVACKHFQMKEASRKI